MERVYYAEITEKKADNNKIEIITYVINQLLCVSVNNVHYWYIKSLHEFLKIEERFKEARTSLVLWI